MEIKTFSSIVTKYINQSVYGIYKELCEELDPKKSIESILLKYIASIIAQIDHNQLHNFKEDLKKPNCIIHIGKNICLDINKVCNIIDLFIDIDNFSGKICCKYMKIHELIRMSISKPPLNSDHPIMLKVLKHKFQLFPDNYNTPGKIHKLWHDNNMPLFDGELMHVTEKPIGPEHVEVTDELVARCKTNIDPNITTTEVVKRLKDNGYNSFDYILDNIDDRIHWTMGHCIYIPNPDNGDIVSLSMSVDELIRILSYPDKYNNK